MSDTPYSPNPAGSTIPSPSTPQPSRDSQSGDLINRATDSAHQAVNKLAEKAGPAVRKLESGASQVNEAIHEQAQHLREKGDEWTGSLRHAVRANPLTSIVLAMAAGALIARLYGDR